MTTAISENKLKKSLFFDYYKYKLFRIKRIAAANIICGVFMAPAVCTAALIALNLAAGVSESDIERSPDIVDNFFVAFIGASAAAVAALMISCAISLILVPVLFSYHHKRNDCDLFYPLPLSVTQRFLGDFSAGLTAVVLPLIINVGAGMALYGTFINTLGGYMSEGEKAHPLIFAVFKSEEFVGRHIDTIDTFVTDAAAAVILLLIGIYIFAVLIFSAAGKAADGAIYSVISLFILPLGAYAAITLYAYHAKGVMVTEKLMPQILSFFPPLGPVIAILSGAGDIKSFNAAAVISVSVVIYALAALGAYLMSAYRKAEQCENPFAFNLVYHILSLSLTAIIICLFLPLISGSDGNARSMTVIMIFLAVLLYFFMEFIKNRGIKKLPYTAIRLFGAAAVSFVIFGVTVPAAANYEAGIIPAVSDTESIYIVSGILPVYGSCEEQLPDEVITAANASNKPLVIKSASDMEVVRSIHSLAIDNSAFTDGYYNFCLCYKLKDGRMFTRGYLLNDELRRKTEYILTKTDGYSDLVYGGIKKLPDDEVNVTYTDPDNILLSCRLNADRREELIKALENDIHSLSGNYLKEKTVLSIEMPEEAISLPITEEYTETLRLLRDNDARAAVNMFADCEDAHEALSITFCNETKLNINGNTQTLLPGSPINIYVGQLEDENVKKITAMMSQEGVWEDNSVPEAYLNIYRADVPTGAEWITDSVLLPQTYYEELKILVGNIIGDYADSYYRDIRFT